MPLVMRLRRMCPLWMAYRQMVWAARVARAGAEAEAAPANQKTSQGGDDAVTMRRSHDLSEVRRLDHSRLPVQLPLLHLLLVRQQMAPLQLLPDEGGRPPRAPAAARAMHLPVAAGIIPTSSTARPACSQAAEATHEVESGTVQATREKRVESMLGRTYEIEVIRVRFWVPYLSVSRELTNSDWREWYAAAHKAVAEQWPELAVIEVPV